MGDPAAPSLIVWAIVALVALFLAAGVAYEGWTALNNASAITALQSRATTDEATTAALSTTVSSAAASNTANAATLSGLGPQLTANASSLATLTAQTGPWGIATQPFVVGASLQTAGVAKAVSLPLPNSNNTATATKIASGTVAGGGILKGVFLSVVTTASPTSTSLGQGIGIQIKIDGTLVVGNASPNFLALGVPGTTFLANSVLTGAGSTGASGPVGATYVDGADQLALTLDRWLNVGTNTGVSVAFGTDTMGSNVCNNQAVAGYVYLDMPFASTWEIWLNNLYPFGGYNAPTAVPQYRVVPYVTTTPTSIIQMNPYGALRLRSATFTWSQTAYGKYYPLLSVTGAGNGVYLRSIKIAMQTPTSGSPGFMEGRFAVWNTKATPYTAPASWGGSPTVTFSSPASLLLASTGAEDFFLSSWGMRGEASGTGLNAATNLYSAPLSGTSSYTTPPVYTKLSRETGILVQQGLPGQPAATPNLWFCAYRHFGMADGVCPATPASDTLTFVYNCGDPVATAYTNQGGGDMFGTVYYYA